ncbi:ATP-dependent DNA helicase DDM1-like isoform X1 [Arachis duranensis]|uniref:ATP-dependent DNA helicase DDM1-like isoform X1 n=1 Tax=Arachis duranensis TaxID=130453 RepID=A0A9C6WFK8_ARADU|nr:ATP-dependent DNA helicase DDM1-like isoform X1 [Arachis duranensis]
MVHEIPNLCSTLRLYGVVELCGCHPSFSSRRRPFGSPPQCAKPLLPPPRYLSSIKSVLHILLHTYIHEKVQREQNTTQLQIWIAICSGRGINSLSNLVIQLREVCNHPNLLESAFDGSWLYPPVNEIVEQCEKFCLLERLLKRLFAKKHKVCSPIM